MLIIKKRSYVKLVILVVSKCDQCSVSNRDDLLPFSGRLQIFSASPVLTTLVHFFFLREELKIQYCETVLKKKKKLEARELL